MAAAARAEALRWAAAVTTSPLRGRAAATAAAVVRRRPAARPSWTTTFRSKRPLGLLGGQSQGPQLRRRLVGRALMDGVPAGGPRAVDIGQDVVDENGFVGPETADLAGEVVDRAIGLGAF